MQTTRKTTDFTEGNIPRHLVTFSIPMLLGNLLHALYNTVDSIWVGQFLGAEALAAVSVGFPVIFALVALIMGITMATTVLVSQYFGARRDADVVRTVNNSLLLLTVFGTAVTVIGILFRRPLLALINTPPEIMEPAASYLGVFLVGLVPMFLYNAVGAILRGLGDSRTPLKFLAYATGLNIVLDPLLIFGPGPLPALGINGAALATVISIVMSAVISLHYLYLRSGIVSYRPGTFRLDWELTKTTFRIGLPSGAQQVFVSLASVVVGSLVNRFGATVVAGFGAAARLDMIAFMPAMSIGLAVSAVVGQNLGAGQARRVSETVRWAMILSGSLTLLVALVAFFAPRALMVLFTQDQAVLAEGSLYLRYMAFSYVPLALMFAMAGVLRGAGDTVPPMLITLGALWVVRVPAATYLSTYLGMGVAGIWLAIAISPYVGLILYYTYYRTGRWKAKAVVRGRAGAPAAVPGKPTFGGYGGPGGPGAPVGPGGTTMPGAPVTEEPRRAESADQPAVGDPSR